MDGVIGFGLIVDWPFSSMILSDTDPELDSLFRSESLLKAKIVSPVHRLINGLFVWEIFFKDFWTPILGCVNHFRCMLSADVSGLVGHSFVLVDVNNALRDLMRTRMSCLFFLSSYLMIVFKELIVLGVIFM